MVSKPISVHESEPINEESSVRLLKNWMEYIIHIQDLPLYSENIKRDHRIKQSDLLVKIKNNIKNTHESKHYYPSRDSKEPKLGRSIEGLMLKVTDGEVRFNFYQIFSKDPTFNTVNEIPLGFTKHVLERLIERFNIHTFSEFKKMAKDILFFPIYESLGSRDIGVDSRLIVVSKDFMIIGDSQNQTHKFITVITDQEFHPEQYKMVKYIIDSQDSPVVLLLTYELPKTKLEADNIIEDTKIRLDDVIKKSPIKRQKHLRGNFV